LYDSETGRGFRFPPQKTVEFYPARRGRVNEKVFLDQKLA